MLRLSLAIAALLGSAQAATAGPASTWAGVVFGVSSQSAGKSDSPYLGPGFGGTATAALFFVDAAITPLISAGAEASVAGDISGTQDQRVSQGSNHVLSEHRDIVFSGVIKVHSAESRRISAAGSVGVGVARRRTRRSGTFASTSPSPVIMPVDEQLSTEVLALTGGVDATVAVSASLRILGLVRVHRLADDDRLADGVVRRGVSSVIVRYGAGVRVLF